MPGHTTRGFPIGLDVVTVMAASQVRGLVPFVGDLLTAGLRLPGLGAVVLTDDGLTTFEPVTIPD